MSRQDKATTERNTKILRELVRRPENKVCADCKRNDPRWASWNIGVFVCIRCSGIHRSMGTHISKVKSVDLDIWTPDQMQSIQKWGNLRANLYWEAHLKPGHIPPDHKMDSFIRSKYESRRWALDGPPPADPSVLEGEGMQVSVAEPARLTTSVLPPTAPSETNVRTALAIPPVPRPPSHILLSSTLAATPKETRAVASPVDSVAQQSIRSLAPASTSKPTEDLFSLDFHSPPPAVSNVDDKKAMKSDILSLFGPAPPTAPNVMLESAAPASLANTRGAAMWGAQPAFSSPAAPLSPQANVWAHPQPGRPQQTSTTPFGSDIWSTGSTQSQPVDLFALGSTAHSGPQTKNDAFSDLWGDFK